MSQFLQRHKRKGVLGLFWLFIKHQKVALPLLLVVVTLSFVFVAPVSITGGFLGAARGGALAWLASKLGLAGVFGLGMPARGGADFTGAMATFQAARDGRGGAAGDVLPGAVVVLKPEDSVDKVVKGNPAEDGLSEAAKRAARGVTGILTPEDAERAGKGVELDESDLTGTRADLLDQAGRDPSALSSWIAAYAKKGFFSGGMSASTRASELAMKALNSSKFPAPTPVRVGASPGKLSAYNSGRASTQRREYMSANMIKTDRRAFHQLAATFALDRVSIKPNCTEQNGCPPEYAVTQTGVPYDNTGQARDVLAAAGSDAPSINGLGGSVGAPPADSLLQGYFDEATQAEEDAKKCKAADEKYVPLENYDSAMLQKAANRYNDLNCGGGGCSKSKAKACKQAGEEEKRWCRQFNADNCAHIMACPITAKDGCGQQASCQ